MASASNADATMASSSRALAIAHDAPAGGVVVGDCAASSAPSAASFALRVGGLPGALSDDAVRALLSHYGATRVRVLRRKKPGAVLHGLADRATQTAIAEFAERARWQDAQQRLAKVQLAGNRLTVEAVGADTDGENQKQQRTGKEVDTETKQNGTPLEPTEAAKVPPPPPQPPLPPRNAPAPLAPHLGLHYAPSPLLQYKYPKATVPVVRNIANALIALPRFYTQVLHLMNKMNLPTPFEDGAIPGRFSEEFMPELRSQVKLQYNDQLVEEDEDESVDEEKPSAWKNESTSGTSVAKRARHANDLKAVTGKKRPRVAMGGGSSHSLPAEQEAFTPPRPGVISSAELDRQRVPDAARARDPVFEGYSRDEPSCRVRVTNVSESVDAKDLEYVFGHVLPLDTPLSSMPVDLDPAISTATVKFPSVESAERAVALIHGVVLSGQPLVVRFAEQETPPPPVNTESSTSKTCDAPPASDSPEGWARMDVTVLALEKAMKNYQRGDPTAALYLKNLAKPVDESVLRSLCHNLLPSSVSSDSITIRHFAEGRMKNQAFIEFPTPEAAIAVLEGIHGLVVHGKPLVVSFRKAQPSQQNAPTQQST